MSDVILHGRNIDVKVKQVGYVLIALIVLGVIGLGVRLISSAESNSPTLTGLQPLTAETIDRIVIRDRENETILTKSSDDSWFSGPYPVVDLKLQDLWETTALFEGARLISDNPDNHVLMGVSSRNWRVVEFWLGEELKEKFIMGDQSYSPIVEEEKPIFPWSAYVLLCYLRLEDQNDVYAVYCPYPDRFDSRDRFWKDPIVIDLLREDVDSFKYTFLNDNFELRIENAAWVIASDDAESVPASPEVVQRFLDYLEPLVAGNFPTEAQLEELEFDKPYANLHIDTKDGGFTEDAELIFVKKTDEGRVIYFVKKSNSPLIYIMSEAEINEILKSRAEFVPTPVPTGIPTRTPTPVPLPTPTATPWVPLDAGTPTPTGG